MTYKVQEFNDGQWHTAYEDEQRECAITALLRRDAGPEIRLRIVNGHGNVILHGRNTKPTPPEVPAKFWTVVTIDTPRTYPTFPTKDRAIREARLRGGRRGVMELVHVTGWLDTEVKNDQGSTGRL